MKEVLSLLKDRAYSADQKALLDIADKPIDEQRTAELKEEIVKTWRSDRELLNFVKGQLGAEKPSALPLITRLSWKIPAASLQANSSWGGFGSILGEELAAREAVRLFHAAETAALPFAECTRLRQLAGQIKDATLALQSARFAPTAVIIPRDERFLFALLRQPSWQLHTRGAATLGPWENLHIIKWPYVDPDSVLVVDLNAFFGITIDQSTLPKITILGPSDNRVMSSVIRSAVLPIPTNCPTINRSKQPFPSTLCHSSESSTNRRLSRSFLAVVMANSRFWTTRTIALGARLSRGKMPFNSHLHQVGAIRKTRRNHAQFVRRTIRESRPIAAMNHVLAQNDTILFDVVRNDANYKCMYDSFCMHCRENACLRHKKLSARSRDCTSFQSITLQTAARNNTSPAKSR